METLHRHKSIPKLLMILRTHVEHLPKYTFHSDGMQFVCSLAIRNSRSSATEKLNAVFLIREFLLSNKKKSPPRSSHFIAEFNIELVYTMQIDHSKLIMLAEF